MCLPWFSFLILMLASLLQFSGKIYSKSMYPPWPFLSVWMGLGDLSLAGP
ncbi:hypothetical protein V6Z11_A13G189200 [Gossypium hirsutum]